MRPCRFLIPLGLALFAGCAHQTPGWYAHEPHIERDAAYDWLLVATGDGQGANREAACDRARETAQTRVRTLFVEAYGDHAAIAAAAGGPLRVGPVLSAFANAELPQAPTTRLSYDDAARRCYLEVRWLLPRHLAEAVRRSVDGTATELSVGEELRRALSGSAHGPAIKNGGALPRASVAEAVHSVYPGWFVRQIPCDCAERALAFVGAPGAAEGRWLTLAERDGGWVIVNDTAADAKGWPMAPKVSCQ